MPQFENEDPFKNVKDTVNDTVNNTADHTSEFDPRDIEDSKNVCILAYFGILFFIPLVAKPQSKFARYHANQGLLFFVLCTMLGAVQIGLPHVPLISPIVNATLGIFDLVLFVIGVVNAVNGKAKDLPIIGFMRLIN